MRIAMWSGPRNLSTALMYAFGNRNDTIISDEPYYGAYLYHSGVKHPMNQIIIDSQPKDPDIISSRLTGTVPEPYRVWYQKLLTHQMLPSFSLDWIAQQQNVFLIRSPAKVIASYDIKRQNPSLDDLGFVQQKKIFDHCLLLGQKPIVIDSEDILANPETSLSGLCEALGIDFDVAMLSWIAGSRAEDGVWASHWYDAVHKSTGFAEPSKSIPNLGTEFFDILTTANKLYEQFKAIKLKT
jgi:hypothetical protein